MTNDEGNAARRDRLRVLLLWPGGLFRGGANFGVPQLLSMAGVLRQRVDAHIDVVDLDMERARGPVDLAALTRGGYELVGVSCYSSYDYLKVMALTARLRQLLPDACFVTGGYHPSARPDDFTGADSPFDYVVVGDGEGVLAELAEELARGQRPSARVLTSEQAIDPNELPPYDWSLLERYRPVAHTIASQAEIYLSRGCPYDCSFCMERAKRETRWRALEPERAVEEIHRFDDFLDLSRWTLFITDALFGMKASWRKTFLEALARRPCRARKLWLLTRIDLIDREDMQLMARANVAPGFGLESGDPDQLRAIGKAGKVDRYLERAFEVAGWARELDVPFGANVIVGHPGETERSMRRSAALLERLFITDPAGTNGFVSVDPYRMYPGSRIDQELEHWQRDAGLTLHRYPWWHDGDQDFLAEWVDPSAALDFRTTLRLRRELFDPILRAIPDRFRYDGPGRNYFMRAVDEQVELTTPRHYLHNLGMWHLWRGLVGETDATSETTPANETTPASDEAAAPDQADGFPIADLARDDELTALARRARCITLADANIEASPALLGALERVPRERYVQPEHIGRSADDIALPLSEDGRSTLSAMHAYAMAFTALELGPGDRLIDLGGGTGYGASVAAEVVGSEGSVLCVEYEPELAKAARELTQSRPQIEVVAGDAHDTARWGAAKKVYAGFAVGELPASWREALAVGGRLVAPIGTLPHQTLTLFEKGPGGEVGTTDLGPVLYVADRACP